jgi:excisionase family DNA binding protein
LQLVQEETMSKTQTATNSPVNMPVTHDKEERLLTIREVSEITGLAVGSLYHLASDGRIPTTRLSKRCLRFRLSALKRWWDERSEYPATQHERQER